MKNHSSQLDALHLEKPNLFFWQKFREIGEAQKIINEELLVI